MKNAGIKSKEEAAQRLIDGEVFYYYVNKIFFDKDLTPPFRYGNDYLRGSWNVFEKWQTKPDWRDEVSKENPVLCWVWDSESDKSIRAVRICEYRKDSSCPYKGISGVVWRHAEPVKPEECRQGGEE